MKRIADRLCRLMFSIALPLAALSCATRAVVPTNIRKLAVISYSNNSNAIVSRAEEILRRRNFELVSARDVLGARNVGAMDIGATTGADGVVIIEIGRISSHVERVEVVRYSLGGKKQTGYENVTMFSTTAAARLVETTKGQIIWNNTESIAVSGGSADEVVVAATAMALSGFPVSPR